MDSTDSHKQLYHLIKGTRRKICIFIHIIKCQSIYYNSVKFEVDLLRNKKVTIYRSALSYKQSLYYDNAVG